LEMPSEVVLTIAVLKEFIHHSRGRAQVSLTVES